MAEIIRSMWTNDKGQDLVEYALILVLMAIAVAVAMIPLGQAVSSVFVRVVACLNASC